MFVEFVEFIVFVEFVVFIVFIELNGLLAAILDCGLRIADLLYRFALSFFIKLLRRRRTVNPKSKTPNPKFILNPEPMNPYY